MSDNNSIFEPAIDKKVEISYDSQIGRAHV